MNLLEIWARLSSPPPMPPSLLSHSLHLAGRAPQLHTVKSGKQARGCTTGTPEAPRVIETQKPPPELRAEGWCGPTLKSRAWPHPPHSPTGPSRGGEGTWGQECRAGQSVSKWPLQDSLRPRSWRQPGSLESHGGTLGLILSSGNPHTAPLPTSPLGSIPASP